MQYALLDNNIKSEPIKGASGLCLGCGKAVIAKCGNIKIHHWAHTSTDKCDSWWENETEWHRNWKNMFPMESREVTFYDPLLKEYHRADIYNSNGVVVELQNSPMSIIELKSRNDFYKKIVWVVNGKKFKGFDISYNIPNPESQELSQYKFMVGKHLMFSRLSESGNRLVEILSLNSAELRHVKPSEIHFAFHWKYTHQSWLSSTTPVFIDLGNDFLYWLKRKQQIGNDYYYLKKVTKTKFLQKYNV